MKGSDKLNLEKISWQMILILFAGFFLVLNSLIPFVADDINYAFIWDGEHGGNFLDGMGERQRVESFTDILISQWSHYFHWGGRTIAHIVVQIFSWIGKIYFDLLNVIVFCALVILIFKIATGLTLREMNKKYLLFILAALYFMTPNFLINTLYMTGSINYLWMTALELLFILPFAMKYRDKNFWRQPPRWSVPLMAVLGLLAGWSIEPGASVTMFVIFFCVIKFWREKNLQAWSKAGFIFLTAGFLILILAPGNFERAILMINPQDAYSFDAVAFRFNEAFLPILIRESLLFLPIIYYFVISRKNSDSTKFILTFCAASIIILCVMMCLPQFLEHAGFTAPIFLLIASTAALKEILPDVKKILNRHAVCKIAAKIFTLFWLLHMGACAYVYADIESQFNARFEYIKANRDAEEIVVPRLVLPAWSESIIGNRTWTNFSLIGGGDLSPDFNNNHNILFAQYYGLKKVRSE